MSREQSYSGVSRPVEHASASGTMARCRYLIGKYAPIFMRKIETVAERRKRVRAAKTTIVIERLITGWSNSETAREVSVSPSTVSEIAVAHARHIADVQRQRKDARLERVRRALLQRLSDDDDAPTFRREVNRLTRKPSPSPGAALPQSGAHAVDASAPRHDKNIT